MGTDELCLRRCQANLLHKDDYYFATVVFHFDSVYRGGEFIIRDQQQGDHSYKPEKRAILINDCSIPHEVSGIESGT